MPGIDARVQRWFHTIERIRITFDNDLFLAGRDIAAGSGTSNCAALGTLSNQLLNNLPALAAIPNGGPAIASAYRVPLSQFSTVAADCVSGDFPAARAALGDTTRGAVAAYGQAQDQVDEILDAGA